MESTHLPSFLESGELARLIPVVADSNKEQRVVSTSLAVFSIVPQFALSLLSEVGAPAGKRSTVRCFTEVVFKDYPLGNKKSRPDGLIIVSSGRRNWTALVEAKTGNAELTSQQVEEYLDIAKKYQLNALITVSNQYATLPSHHPLDINKSKRRSVDLFHFSWMAIASKAILLAGGKVIEDPEQAYILSEYIRFLDHESSGVLAFNKMPKGWKSSAQLIQHGSEVNKRNEDTLEAVGGWHALARFLCLELAVATGAAVSIKLPRAQAHDQGTRVSADAEMLATQHQLNCTLEVPNTAGSITITADFLRRVISISSRITPPQDKSQATACVNWLTKQLPEASTDSEILLRAIWPGRTTNTDSTLLEARTNPSDLTNQMKGMIPREIEIKRVIDMGGKFTQSQVFVEELGRQIPAFYRDIMQHIRPWFPSAPKIRPSEGSTSKDNSADNAALRSFPETETTETEKINTQHASDETERDNSSKSAIESVFEFRRGF